MDKATEEWEGHKEEYLKKVEKEWNDRFSKKYNGDKSASNDEVELPNMSYDFDEKETIEAWRELARPICEATGHLH